MTPDDVHTNCSLPVRVRGHTGHGAGVHLRFACSSTPPPPNDGSCIFEGDPCNDGDATTFNDFYTDCDAPNYGCAGEVIDDGCPEDFDGDGLIAVSDVLFLLGNFGCLSNCIADINGDDAVTAADMLAILAVFGTPCAN